jgi:hypothetical protein
VTRLTTVLVTLALLVPASSAVAQDDGDFDSPEEDEPLDLPVLGETTFSLTNTSILQYRGDNFNANRFDDDFLALTERLELAAQGEEVRVSLRLDGFAPLLESTCPEGPEEVLCFLDWDVRPERFTIQWQHDDLTLEVGDSYAVLGRGLALSLRKVDILGVDTAVRGAHVQYDTGRYFLRALSGLSNPQNLDPITLEIVDDPTDVMVGAEAGVRLGEYEDVELGLHTMRIWFERDGARERDVTADLLGWHFAVPSMLDGHLALYGEVNALRRNVESDLLGNSRQWGRAVYGSVQLQLELITILVEWKDYRDYIVAADNGEVNASRIYSAAPALDRDTERYRAIHNARGGRLQVNYAVPETSWSISGNAVVYGHNEERHEDPWDGILVTHGYLEFERQNASVEQDEIGWSLTAVAGYRRETYLFNPFDEDLGEGDPDWTVVHGEVDTTVAHGNHSFELRLEQRFERARGALDYRDYERGGITLTWSLGGTLSISPTVRWDTERPEVPNTFIGLFDAQTYYPSLEGRWDFADGSFVRLFAGQTPGGRLCSGGVCRDVPLFEGALTELVLRL